MGDARDENNFLRPSAKKLGHAMSGGIEAFSKMQLDESVGIALYGPTDGLLGSENRFWHGAVGA